MYSKYGKISINLVKAEKINMSQSISPHTSKIANIRPDNNIEFLILSSPIHIHNPLPLVHSNPPQAANAANKKLTMRLETSLTNKVNNPYQIIKSKRMATKAKETSNNTSMQAKKNIHFITNSHYSNPRVKKENLPFASSHMSYMPRQISNVNPKIKIQTPSQAKKAKNYEVFFK